MISKHGEENGYQLRGKVTLFLKEIKGDGFTLLRHVIGYEVSKRCLNQSVE